MSANILVVEDEADIASDCVATTSRVPDVGMLNRSRSIRSSP